MAHIDQVVTGGAAETFITTAMTASVPGVGGTFTVDDDTGYPASGRFTVVLDANLPTEEKILITSRSGTTFTVGQRGYDNTVAASHTINQASVMHPLAAAIVQALIDHVEDVEADPHSTKLLNNARHDITARHQFGGALGTPGTPAALTPDIAGSAGAGSVPARSDHVHNVPAAVVGAIQPDDTASEGVAASFARSDHRHSIGAATPVSVGTALAEGVSTSFARADHAHDLANGSIDASALFGANVLPLTAIPDALITLAKFASEPSVDFSASVTFTNPTGNFVLGTGGIKYANYFKLGRIVVYWVHFTLGTGGNITAGGTIEVNLPFQNAASHRGFAAAKARQNGGLVSSGTAAIGVSTSVVTNFVAAGVSASWDATAPFNWDAGDAFDAIVVYEASA